MSVRFSYSSPGKDRRHPQAVALLVYQTVTSLFPEKFPSGAPSKRARVGWAEILHFEGQKEKE